MTRKTVQETVQEVTQEVTQKKHEISIYSANLNDMTLKDKKLNIAFSNVKDYDYFSRGISFFNYASIIVVIEAEKKKVDAILTNIKSENVNYEDDPVFAGYKQRLKDLDSFLSKINGYRNNLNISEEEQKLFKSDNFMRLTACVLFKIQDEIALPNMDEVINALEGYDSVHKLDNVAKKSKDAFLKLKEELQKMASLYDTKDGVYYKNSKLNVNHAMTSDIFRIGYGGCKLDKSGNFVRTKSNVKKIRAEIIAQFTGRLQGSIENVE